MESSPYAKLTVKNLKLELEKRGKETTGRKEALIARLELADAEALSDMDDDEEEEEEVPEEMEKVLLDETEGNKEQTKNVGEDQDDTEVKMETDEQVKVKEEETDDKNEEKAEMKDDTEEEKKEEVNMEEEKKEEEKKEEENREEENEEEKKEEEKKEEEKEKKSETDLPMAFGKGQKQVEISLESDEEGEGDSKKKKQWFYQVWTPDKNRIAADIATHNNAKLLNIYPVQIEDLSDAQLLEVLPCCEEFSFNFYQKADSTFAGLIYLKFNSVEDRDDAQTSLKFRDDVNIKESLSDKEYQDIYKDFKGGKDDKSKESIGDLIERILYITPLPKDTTLEELAPFFPEAEEIYLYNADKEIETDGATGYAYVFYPEKELAHKELLKHFDPEEPYKIKEDKVFYVNSCKEHREGSDPMFQVMRRDKREFHMKSLKQIQEDIAKTPEKETVCKKKVRAIRYHYRHLQKDEDKRTKLELPLLEPTLKEVIPDVEKEVWKPSAKEEAEEKKNAEEEKKSRFQDRKPVARGGARGVGRGGFQRGGFQPRGNATRGRDFHNQRNQPYESRRGGVSPAGGFQRQNRFSPGGGGGGREAGGFGGYGSRGRFQGSSPQEGYRQAGYGGGPRAYEERSPEAYRGAQRGSYFQAQAGFGGRGGFGGGTPPVDSKRKLLEKLSSLLEDEDDEPAPSYGGGYKRAHDGYGNQGPKRGRYDAYSQGRPGGYY